MADHLQAESEAREAAKPRISHATAREAASRFIDSHFDNPGRTRPKISIPASPDDDDLLLVAYIEQGADREALLKQCVEALELSESVIQLSVLFPAADPNSAIDSELLWAAKISAGRTKEALAAYDAMVRK